MIDRLEARLSVALKVEPATIPSVGRSEPSVGAKVDVAPNEGADEAEPVNGGGAPAMTDPDETNVWPTATEEAAFLSEARGRGEVVVPVARATADEVEDSGKTLPKLDELVQRIPADARELLDELFRAKFVAVRRVRKADLKP